MVVRDASGDITTDQASWPIVRGIPVDLTLDARESGTRLWVQTPLRWQNSFMAEEDTPLLATDGAQILVLQSDSVSFLDGDSLNPWDDMKSPAREIRIRSTRATSRTGRYRIAVALPSENKVLIAIDR